MPEVFIDYETRSRVKITDGTDRYMTAAEAIICSLAVGDASVKVWDILHEPMPDWYVRALNDLDSIFIAANFQHDRQTTERLLGIKTHIEQWRCTRAMANAHGLPGSLEGACNALRVPLESAKSHDGKRLIQLFCVPKKDGTYRDPKDYWEEWTAFKAYAARDTKALRAVYRRLPTHNFTGTNLSYFWLDARINERGFAVDLPLIEAASGVLNNAKANGDAEVSRRTGGEVTAVTQRDKLLNYLTRHGVALPNLTKAELENALQDSDLSPEQRFLVEARLEGARASGAKYKRAIKTHVGGRVRFTQQFSGAGRTGRTAHKGFQPGNMPRAVTYNPLATELALQHVPVKAAYIDAVILPAIRSGDCDPIFTGGPYTACANAVRHCIIAEPGNELIVADYKNIESRIMAWYADESWRLVSYAAQDRGEGVDLYRQLYSQFFGTPLDKINEHERNAGKVVTLACDFGGAVGAVVTMAVTYGIDLSVIPKLVLPNAKPAQLKKAEDVWWRAFLSGEDWDLEPEVYMGVHVLVQMYRAANPRVDQFKKDVGKATSRAVNSPGRLFEVSKLKIWREHDVLIIQLPNEYRLYYWHPTIEVEHYIDVETGEPAQREYLSFLRNRGGKMIRERTWPGLTVENIAQSTANQVLRYGKIEVDHIWPGSLVLAIHDEAGAEARTGQIQLKPFMEHLCKGWWWTKGLPLAAEGWVGPRYGKR